MGTASPIQKTCEAVRLYFSKKSDAYFKGLPDANLERQRRLFSRVKECAVLFLLISLLDLALGIFVFTHANAPLPARRYSPCAEKAAGTINIACSSLLAAFFFVSLFTQTWKRWCLWQIERISEELGKRRQS